MDYTHKYMELTKIQREYKMIHEELSKNPNPQRTKELLSRSDQLGKLVSKIKKLWS